MIIETKTSIRNGQIVYNSLWITAILHPFNSYLVSCIFVWLKLAINSWRWFEIDNIEKCMKPFLVTFIEISSQSSRSFLVSSHHDNNHKMRTIEFYLELKQRKLPNCLHCVVFPDRSHPSKTIKAPRNGTVLHMFCLFCFWFLSVEKFKSCCWLNLKRFVVKLCRR